MIHYRIAVSPSLLLPLHSVSPNPEDVSLSTNIATHNELASAPSKLIGLMDLPSELRDIVYKYALASDGETMKYAPHIDRVTRYYQRNLILNGPRILSLLQTSKQVHEELIATKNEAEQRGIVELATERLPAKYLLHGLSESGVHPTTLSFTHFSAWSLVNFSFYWGEETLLEPDYCVNIAELDTTYPCLRAESYFFDLCESAATGCNEDKMWTEFYNVTLDTEVQD